MIEFYGHGFMSNLTQLICARDLVAKGGLAKGPSTELDADTKRFLVHLAKGMRGFCDACGLQAASLAVAGLQDRCTYCSLTCNWQLVESDLVHFFEQFWMELGKQRFAFISPDRHRFFQQDDLFQLGSPPPFPAIAQDIKDAGNCLAADLSTAAVFHLMRVAEWGLRSLAKKAGVRVKKTPLDWAEWRTLIDGIRVKKVVPIAGKRRGPKKDADLEFYRGLLGEFEAFKDVYRNQVMHSRRTYDHREAESAMLHVGEFLRRLAPRLLRLGSAL
jgi:hypothetical protein